MSSQSKKLIAETDSLIFCQPPKGRISISHTRAGECRGARNPTPWSHVTPSTWYWRYVALSTCIQHWALSWPGMSWARGCSQEQDTQSVASWSIIVWTFLALTRHWALVSALPGSTDLTCSAYLIFRWGKKGTEKLYCVPRLYCGPVSVELGFEARQAGGRAHVLTCHLSPPRSLTRVVGKSASPSFKKVLIFKIIVK